MVKTLAIESVDRTLFFNGIMKAGAIFPANDLTILDNRRHFDSGNLEWIWAWGR